MRSWMLDLHFHPGHVRVRALTYLVVAGFNLMPVTKGFWGPAPLLEDL